MTVRYQLSYVDLSADHTGRTTIFSPEGKYLPFNPSVNADHIGRLFQVEYAMEAISHAGTVLAVASKEGIAMAAEKVSQLPYDECQADNPESNRKVA